MERETLGIGMLGYGFMGRAHAAAFRALEPLPGPLRARLVAAAGRNEAALAEAARSHGFERWTTDWRELVADPEIELFDNTGPNALHVAPTVAAAAAGKHVLCEKPLGRSAAEARELWTQADAAGVVHMTGFNYRFVPAVRLARELLEAGEVGDVHHVRVRYLQDWGLAARPDAWRFDPEQAGSGALGDLGSHAVDLVRYLAGEVVAVSALTRSFVEGRDVDDAFVAIVELENGALGTLEASRVALGRRNALAWEVNGSRGSLAFELERLNEFRVCTDEPGRTRGFRTVLVTDPDHPFAQLWWPPGHVLGWEHTFVHELHHLLSAIAEGTSVAPHGATFEDGYRAAVVCDGIARAAASGGRERLAYG